MSSPERPLIAWGTSKLLEFTLAHRPDLAIDAVVDGNNARHDTTFHGHTVQDPRPFLEQGPSAFRFAVFAVSSHSLQAILATLNRYGFRLDDDVELYSDLLYEGFTRKASELIGRPPDPARYRFARAMTLTSTVPIHTTILGNHLLLELIEDLDHHMPEAPIAEVGAFRGGNALVNQLYQAGRSERDYYIIDSFEGFPEVGREDPDDAHAGQYAIDVRLESVYDTFSHFPNAHVVHGAVPDVLDQFPERKWGLIFYDCDLYQPALDTFAYFWPRLRPGGAMVVHDYHHEEGGFSGVQKATHEFFDPLGIPVHTFWENTMAVAMKPRTEHP